MNRLNGLLRWALSLFVVVSLAFGIAGCEGSKGARGADGAPGPAGQDGQPGTPGAGLDPVEAAIAEAKVESCGTCHSNIGEEGHQSVYDKYVDDSTLVMTFNNVTSSLNPDGVTYTVTLNFSITKDGLPFVDAAGLGSLDQKSFWMVRYNSTTRQYLQNKSLSASLVVPGAAPGDYVLTVVDAPYAPETPVAPFDGAQVYGYIADGALLEHAGEAGAELPAGSHVHLYDDVSNTALAFGTAVDGVAGAYTSAANVSGCENCHGQPYLKHGYRGPEVAGLPDFASCKSCHFDDRNGGHQDWQYMVDDPLNWGTAGLPIAEVRTKYAYKAKLMNDVHMAHAMEFPYPQSMANCSTCHEDKLDQVLANTNFTPETCKSCHPVDGLNAWPAAVGTVSAGVYRQPERAPPLAYLWAKHDVEWHNDFIANPGVDCQECHKPALDGGIGRLFSEYHTGYDTRVADDTGTKYRDDFIASIDDVSVDGDVMTIAYSADASGVADAVRDPETLDVNVYVSFFGWDTKHFIVPSHTTDASGACWSTRNGVTSPSSCRYEVSTLNFSDEPTNTAYNPLFPSLTETATAPGSWELTVDMAAWIGGQPGFIPDLIADKTIKKALITLAPRLRVVGHDDEEIAVNLNAVTKTVDLGTGAFVANYFAGTKATVDTALCDKCHDQLAVSFHGGSGRGGDIMACKNCHNPTYPGSHVEMASRSIENYVHAIHSFQSFDVDTVFHDDAPPGDPAHGEDYDPVLAKRYDQHIQHVFPNFTIRNCEACHIEGTFDVPDQSKSMPGVLSQADTVDNWYEMVNTYTVPGAVGVACESIATAPFFRCIPDEIAVLKDERNIGSVPEVVVGPASRSCGGCHRAEFINADDAGGLASFNAHTQAGGTLVKNDGDTDVILFGIIDKIMKLFE